MTWRGELTSYFETNQLNLLMSEVINPAESVSINRLSTWVKEEGFNPELDDYKVLAQICHVKKANEKSIAKQYQATNSVQKAHSKTFKLDRDGRIIVLRFLYYNIRKLGR